MKALTIQIAILGKINSGKSSLMNFMTGQNASIISEVPGTTTDVVWKQMELNPLGPVTLFDTAGIDDVSALGEARIEKAKRAFDSSDVILLMLESGKLDDFEKNIFKEAKERKTPVIAVVGKIDLSKPSASFISEIKTHTPYVLKFSSVSSGRDAFLDELKRIFVEVLPENFIENYSSLKNIVKENDTVVLVTPIDAGAPRGRMIMPQAQTLRNLLDLNACVYTAQDGQYETALANLKTSPALVVTDSQVIKKVAAETPANIKLTTFSTIYAADKSDIVEMAKGAAALSKLKDGGKVLIAEACTHHASSDDIGRVKIPRWLGEFTGRKIMIEHSRGQDYPQNLKDYKLIIHCGACTLNRKGMLARLNKAVKAGVPVTNYGIAISALNGVIEKVLEVFPEALKAYKTAIGKL